MNFIQALQAAYSLVSVFGPMVPEVVEAIPTIAADAKKIVADLGKHDVGSSIADIEATVSAVPSDVVGKVLEASKGLKL